MLRTPKALAASSLLALTLALAGWSGPAAAGDAVMLSTDASQCEIFRALNPVVPMACQQPGDLAVAAELGGFKTRSLKTRSIKLHGPSDEAAPAAPDQGVAGLPESERAPAPAPETTVAAVQQPDQNRDFAMAMRIQFEYDSAALTKDARETLDRVAEVLKDGLMQDKVIMLEGHADATGGDDYNLNLSNERARSVQIYLVQEHGIPADRLPFVGMGETDPFDAQHPTDGVNRRVEFTNLTS
jgi:outer membrane protein OmpA-like peptidoglycan-associated protein